MIEKFWKMMKAEGNFLSKNIYVHLNFKTRNEQKKKPNI